MRATERCGQDSIPAVAKLSTASDPRLAFCANWITQLWWYSVSFHAAASLCSPRFLKIRRRRLYRLPPSAAALGLCCCDGMYFATRKTSTQVKLAEAHKKIQRAAFSSLGRRRKKAPSCGACVGVGRLGWPMAPGWCLPIAGLVDGCSWDSVWKLRRG